MKRRLIIVIIVVVAAAVAAGAWWYTRQTATNGALVLYGNVDLRQVNVAFDASGRIAEVLVEEGDRVTKGETIARLDTSLLAPQVAQAEAEVAAQSAAVDKLRAGSRPEEISEARANVDSATADAEYARLSYERYKSLSTTSAGVASVTQSQVDQARATYDAATGKLAAAEQVLALALAGPRLEEISQAEAVLSANQAALTLAKQQLANAELVAPVDGIVRSRLLEPGEMASPQAPVASLAIVDPKWVRAYVSEPDLPKVASGMAATITIDGVAKPLDGWIGFISPVAEFTPRAIETTELRTSLVYEVRVMVKDPDGVLRLGMPATVRLAADQAAAKPAEPAQ